MFAFFWIKKIIAALSLKFSFNRSGRTATVSFRDEKDPSRFRSKLGQQCRVNYNADLILNADGFWN
jgi:hypothetical protein